MKQLENTIEKLKTDHYHAVTIIDRNNLRKLFRDMTGVQMIADFGSVESFFNKLAEKTDSYQVQDKRKNGSTFCIKPNNPPYNVEINPKAVTVEKTEKVYEPTVMQSLGLNGSGLFGLSMPDLIHKTMDYPRIIEENRELKAKNDKLTKDNEDLKTKNLRNEISGEKGANNVAMVQALSESPILAGLAQKLLTPATPQASLGSPALNLSPVKKQMFEIMNHTEDNFIEYLISITQAMSSNDEFGNDLIAVMEKHKLIT